MEMARLPPIQVKPHTVTGVSTEEYTAVPMQGSGTFSVESVFQTAVPRTNGKVGKTTCDRACNISNHQLYIKTVKLMLKL